MPLAELFALEADYRTTRDHYKATLDTLNHGKAPKKSDLWRAAQLNADMQSTLQEMALHAPLSEGFKLFGATEALENEYEKLMGDSRAILTMRYTRAAAWVGLVLVLLVIYFRT